MATVKAIAFPKGKHSIVAHGFYYSAQRNPCGFRGRNWTLYSADNRVVFDGLGTYNECVETAMADASFNIKIAAYAMAHPIR